MNKPIEKREPSKTEWPYEYGSEHSGAGPCEKTDHLILTGYRFETNIEYYDPKDPSVIEEFVKSVADYREKYGDVAIIDAYDNRNRLLNDCYSDGRLHVGICVPLIHPSRCRVLELMVRNYFTQVRIVGGKTSVTLKEYLNGIGIKEGEQEYCQAYAEAAVA